MCSASGRDVAVVEVQAERAARRTRRRCDSPGAMLAGAEARDAVHPRRVDAVEVDRVRVLGAVDERDRAAARPRARAASGPGRGRCRSRPRNCTPGATSISLSLGDELPLAHDAPVAAGGSCPSRSRAGSRAGRSRSSSGRPCRRPRVQRVLHRHAAGVGVVPAAVPVLGERRADGVMKPLMRHHLVQPQGRTHPGRAPEQPAPRKFALPKFHI